MYIYINIYILYVYVYIYFMYIICICIYILYINIHIHVHIYIQYIYIYIYIYICIQLCEAFEKSLFLLKRGIKVIICCTSYLLSTQKSFLLPFIINKKSAHVLENMSRKLKRVSIEEFHKTHFCASLFLCLHLQLV